MNELFIISEMAELHKILDAVNERLLIVAMSVADSKKTKTKGVKNGTTHISNDTH